MTPRRVVFVSHNASRSGAPLLLLQVERWLREHRDLDVTTVLLAGGPLVEDFEAAGGAHPVEDLASLAPDLVYLNTVGSAPALAQVPAGTRVVCHVHELDYALTHWITEDDRAALRDRVDRFLVVSDLVADALRRCVGIEDERIVRHYGFVDVGAVRDAVQGPPPAAAVGSGPLVAASGTTEWRKAPDLFVALAAVVHRRRPDVRFVWVGGSATGPEIDGVLADRDRLGLRDVVAFVGEQEDARPWFAASDVFALVSRDDPFPLTCLEAAALGVPVVAFDSTGAREFLADGCGVVVPYPDVESMAEAVLHLLDDPDRVRALTGAARRRVEAGHDLAGAVPRLVAEIESLLPGGPS
ncbi:MAG: glycosyltransferase family 4 protein [Acidimicrobiales bacterium]|nr:glycosyltransferase family 4 protein [Acidimicrobiales bacterium]